MKSIIFIGVLAILLPYYVSAQEAKIQLTPKVSIIFPEKPTVREMQGVTTIYSVRLADSTANLNVVVSDLEKSAGLSAESLETEQQNPVFWEQVEAGFMAQVGQSATLLSKQIIERNNKKMLQLLISNERNGKKSELSILIFVDGVYSFNIGYTKRTNEASTGVKDKFYSSLQFTN
jgi:hypothetical protein